MKSDASKEYNSYIEAKDRYMQVAKVYSALLATTMDMDPNILKIAEDILVTGDGLSSHDNRFLTSFYQELRAKSKIDKRYYQVLLDIKKTKNQLDHAVTLLSKKRIAYMLRKSGIPPRRVNADRDFIAAQVNSPSTSLLEKISLPEILDLQAAETLDSYMAGGELVLAEGNLVPKTKAAREFVRSLEAGVIGKVNDSYFGSTSRDPLASLGNLGNSNTLDFVRVSADVEHIREIERKLAVGDIFIQNGDLSAANEKGQKYLALLTEELTAQFDRKTTGHMLSRNSQHAETDPRLVGIRSTLADLDISLDKHTRYGKLAREGSAYHNVLRQATSRQDYIQKAFADLLTMQETIAISFADIKKQLLSTLANKKLAIDSLLPLLIATRYISVYEKKYEERLGQLESLLGVSNESPASPLGPETLTRLTERYGSASDTSVEHLGEIYDLMKDRLGARREFDNKTTETLLRSLLSSTHMRRYKSLVNTQNAAKKHIVDTLYTGHCLYIGLTDVGEVLTELTELEIEKGKILADFVHELEMAHKELWLARITNNNKHFIDSNFGDIPEKTKTKVIGSNIEAVDMARAEISATLNKFRTEHRKHSEAFGKELRRSLQEISKGGDVTKISEDLKSKYKDMNLGHDKLMKKMEKDIVALEKRLTDFEAKAPAEIERLLMSDIRSSI